MKNKGFTLVEMLAVITVLALMLLIAVPAAINLFKKSEVTISDSQKTIVYAAADSYILEKSLNLFNNSHLCIRYENLTNEGFIPKDAGFKELYETYKRYYVKVSLTNGTKNHELVESCN